MLLAKKNTYSGMICTGQNSLTTSACTIGLMVLGAFLVISPISVCLLFRSMGVKTIYSNIETRSHLFFQETLLRIMVPVILGGVSIITINDKISIICSLVWLGITLVDVLRSLNLPQFSANFLNRGVIVIKIIAAYIIAQCAVAYWKQFTVPVILPFACSVAIKMCLNVQHKLLWSSWRALTTLEDRTLTKTSISFTKLDVSLRILCATFARHQKLDYKQIEMLGPVWSYINHESKTKRGASSETRVRRKQPK